MIRRRSAVTLLSCAALALPAQGAAGQSMRAETVAPGCVVFSGFSNGNVLAVIGDSGVLLVDAQSARRAPQLDSALRTITTQPVRWVVTTHYHADHLEGNAYWRSRGADILAHQRVGAEARKDTTVAELQWHRAPAVPGALPTRTFRRSMVLHVSGRPVVVTHAPAAHTSGDALVWVPDANVVHLGDILELGAPPFVDWWAGGTLDGVIAAVDTVLLRIDDRTRIVPGHGAVTDRAGLAAYREMLGTVRGRIHAAIAAGQREDDPAVLDAAAGFVDRLGGERRARQFVALLHHGLRTRATAAAPRR